MPTCSSCYEAFKPSAPDCEDQLCPFCRVDASLQDKMTVGAIHAAAEKLYHLLEATDPASPVSALEPSQSDTLGHHLDALNAIHRDLMGMLRPRRTVAQIVPLTQAANDFLRDINSGAAFGFPPRQGRGQ